MVAARDFEQHLRRYFPFGFQVSRRVWEKLRLSEVVSELPDDLRKAESYPIRRLAARYNEAASKQAPPLQTVRPGELVTVAMIVELMRYIIFLYCCDQNPGILRDGLDWARLRRDENVAELPPPAFVRLFPPETVVRGEELEETYLRSSSEIATHREEAVMEMILLRLAMINPSFRPFISFFDDSELRVAAPYETLVDALEEFFEQQPPIQKLGTTLLRTLKAPIEDSPDSLEGQLDFIRRHWAPLLTPALLQRLLRVTGILREEYLMRGFGEPLLEVLQFGKGWMGYPEYDAFSQDADWMSNFVLIAKSIYVWLDQLSRKYQRHLRILSDIPDEELDQLARWGFSGLWLIGVWERSRASQRIKQMMGNPEAMSSAYSLYDYNISTDLGGDEAYLNLKERAWRRGIRLAADMVPNHMGIRSRWVIEHPQWFIQSDYPPFPVYRFSGENLSEDQRVVIQIEDGYWQHRDAAVVFKRTDTWTGDERYIYHGNDGTNMPWNDTAQLNFLLPEVREAVIQTILHVARRFPIIRFDAAMTLAKKHYQRLWFPQPGEGGAIPSRAERGLTREQFDAAMPKEFWREVVDRIKAEAPDTLLLAEAFWLMEGYFVRTLGMHRVYNSAFMNMLKMEENSKYRQTVKNVLEFSPEVLKRFVNFMNNPDEKTAVEQFGKGDKYIGVAIMMVTMPGLPMFGHGQIEGFAEKYGMEYRRAYWDEQVDWDLVRRHEREVFPLMRRRKLFSGAENFVFYDFWSDKGWVDENVFAYSNRYGDERALILYNNSYNTTAGWVRTSTAINAGSADQPKLIQKTLAEALDFRADEGVYYTFREHQSGLCFIRSGRELAEKGLFAILRGYQYHAFIDFREISDADGSWRRLMEQLDGSGVPEIELARKELVLEPLLTPLRCALSAESLKSAIHTGELLDKSLSCLREFYRVASVLLETPWDPEMEIRKVNTFVAGTGRKRAKKRVTTPAVEKAADKDPEDGLTAVLICLHILRPLRKALRTETEVTAAQLGRLVDDWLLDRALHQQLAGFFHDDAESALLAKLTVAAFIHANPLQAGEPEQLIETLTGLFTESHSRELLLVNRYNNTLWFNRERWELLVRCWALAATSQRSALKAGTSLRFREAGKLAESFVKLAEESGYSVTRFLELCEERVLV